MNDEVLIGLSAFLFGLALGILLCVATVKLSGICERPVIVEHMIGE